MDGAALELVQHAVGVHHLAHIAGDPKAAAEDALGRLHGIVQHRPRHHADQGANGPKGGVRLRQRRRGEAAECQRVAGEPDRAQRPDQAIGVARGVDLAAESELG